MGQAVERQSACELRERCSRGHPDNLHSGKRSAGRFQQGRAGTARTSALPREELRSRRSREPRGCIRFSTGAIREQAVKPEVRHTDGPFASQCPSASGQRQSSEAAGNRQPRFLDQLCARAVAGRSDCGGAPANGDLKNGAPRCGGAPVSEASAPPEGVIGDTPPRRKIVGTHPAGGETVSKRFATRRECACFE